MARVGRGDADGVLEVQLVQLEQVGEIVEAGARETLATLFDLIGRKSRCARQALQEPLRARELHLSGRTRVHRQHFAHSRQLAELSAGRTQYVVVECAHNLHEARPQRPLHLPALAHQPIEAIGAAGRRRQAVHLLDGAHHVAILPGTMTMIWYL